MDALLSSYSSHPVLVPISGALALGLAVGVYYSSNNSTSSSSGTSRLSESGSEAGDKEQEDQEEKEEAKSIMQPARTDLEPPKDTPFTQAELKQFDGSDESKPIYVAIKGEYLVLISLF
jgi:hypothetical protein